MPRVTRPITRSISAVVYSLPLRSGFLFCYASNRPHAEKTDLMERSGKYDAISMRRMPSRRSLESVAISSGVHLWRIFGAKAVGPSPRINLGASLMLAIGRPGSSS